VDLREHKDPRDIRIGFKVHGLGIRVWVKRGGREGRGGKLEVPMRSEGNAPLTRNQDMEGMSINHDDLGKYTGSVLESTRMGGGTWEGA
jgi:hypothetical protein